MMVWKPRLEIDGNFFVYHPLQKQKINIYFPYFG